MKYKMNIDIWIDVVDRKTRLEAIDEIRKALLTCKYVKSFDWNDISAEEDK